MVQQFSDPTMLQEENGSFSSFFALTQVQNVRTIRRSRGTGRNFENVDLLEGHTEAPKQFLAWFIVSCHLGYVVISDAVKETFDIEK